MIDEVQVLQESRGATLEAIVSRMKTIASSSNKSIRYLAASVWRDREREGRRRRVTVAYRPTITWFCQLL
jgi:superfamily II helicase